MLSEKLKRHSFEKTATFTINIQQQKSCKKLLEYDEISLQYSIHLR